MKDNAQKIAEEAMKAANAAQGNDWPEPLPIHAELHPVEPFNPEALLTDVVRDWVMDGSDRMPCPPDYIAASLIVTLGSVIGARCVIKPKQFDDWAVVPNLWGGIVGPPTAKKSPAITAALKPLDRLIALAQMKHKGEIAEYQTGKTMRDARKTALEKELSKAAVAELHKRPEIDDEE